MKHFTLTSVITKHRHTWSEPAFVVSALVAVLFFAFSLYVNYRAVWYASVRAGNSTTDFLLQHVPVVNTDLIFSQGSLLFVAVVAVLLLLEPKTLPFVLKSVALFVCIRAGFVMMTHLGPFPDHISTDFDRWRYMSSGSDLFFSGHTGLPFLMALIYWRTPVLRIVFLVSSVVAGAAVILGHLHYTIDVFSAFFIAYGIYHMAQRLFPLDYQRFIK